jgi:hypothetical protein
MYNLHHSGYNYIIDTQAGIFNIQHLHRNSRHHILYNIFMISNFNNNIIIVTYNTSIKELESFFKSIFLVSKFCIFYKSTRNDNIKDR